ncbi:MAG: RNA pseudouridine synthase [Myxococcota bacterium]
MPNRKNTTPCQEDPVLQLLARGSDYVVVHKPAGIAVVQYQGNKQPTLLELMQELVADNIQPVHRLDRATSGCCLFAQGPTAQRRLSFAFRNRQVDKRYLALVEGCPQFDKTTIDLRLKRIDTPHAKKGPVARQVVDKQGKEAISHLSVWHTGQQISAVEVRPVTGRMHQIRAHLAAIGHPVVGDRTYGSQLCFAPNAIALLAFALRFRISSNKHKSVTSHLPEQFVARTQADGFDIRQQFAKTTQRFCSQ